MKSKGYKGQRRWGVCWHKIIFTLDDFLAFNGLRYWLKCCWRTWF